MGGPRMVTVSRSGGGGGVECCCCRCCTCLHLQFLKTTPGALKIAEVVAGALCQSLLINFGLIDSGRLGASFVSFLTTVSSCLMTTSLLLACYVLSENSFRLIRSSLFETLFNAVASFLFLSASSYLAFSVIEYLLPVYKITPFYQAYPAMTSAYMFGLVLGVLHGIDAYLAYRHFRGVC
ncbi:protein singles bar [Anabrus simplex]|uniref:protein singles bar n=1 Tax=Anabrus simplex TaxID=316456 RepID=UPI0035A3884E